MKLFSLKYILPLFTLIVMNTGCQKYLDIKPKGVDVVSTIDQYSGLFNNILLTTFSNYTAYAGGVSPGNDANLTVLMSDEAMTTAPYSSRLAAPRSLNAYHWAANIYLPDEDAAEWTAFYQLNYTYNVIVNGVMNASGGTEQQKKQLLAEARANRAYLHFWLVNYFGKPYDASSSSTDPGIPITTIADAPASAGPRASVQEVYDFVIGELKAANADIPEDEVNRLRVGKAATTFMLAQVYFFQKKYDSALAELELSKALAENNSTPMNFYDYNVTVPQWTFDPNFPPNFPFGPNNLEAICQRQIYQFAYNSTAFLKPEYLSLYDPADMRLKFFSATDFSGAPYPSLTRATPFASNYGPSIPNLYLMMAECKARLNDVPGATADLLTLRQNRMPADVAAVPALDKDGLIRFIIDERFREYALTGLCWFDMRRLWNDPLFAGKDYTHTDNTGTYHLTPDRLTLEVPPKILNINPGMENNP